MAINTKEYKATKHTGVKIHKDGIRFLLDVIVDGKRNRRVFKSNPVHSAKDRLKTAYGAAESFKQEIEHRENIKADVNATVLDYWTKLKIVKGWNDDMVKSYDYYYCKHLSKLSDKKVRDIRSAHFTSLNVSLKDLAPRTKLKAYEILKPLFDLAVEDEIIATSPIKKSHIPVRKQIEEKKIITDAASKYRKVHEAIHTLFGTEDVIRIDDMTTIQCHDNPHHRAAFLLGFYGRRLNEVLSLEWADIDFTNDTFTIRGTNSKVNTDMEFALPSDVREALLEFKDNTGRVFAVKSLDRHHQKIRDYTGIEEYTFHWMRNLSVSALASMGADITHLSAMLGHNDASTVKKYLSLQRATSTKAMNEVSQKLLS